MHTWTEFEEKPAIAVAIVTKVALEEICPDRSLFSLGIDSISAISLPRALHQQFEVRIEISEILKNPSVRRLAEKLSKNLAGKRTVGYFLRIGFNGKRIKS
jgi:acyl carrier protein